LIVLASLSACFGGQKPQAADVKLSEAPAAYRARPNPYAGASDAVLAGKKLFKHHCAACHGADGSGKEKAPDLHSLVIHSASPGALFWFLKNGDLKKGMPAWSRLPDQQIWQLVTFLQTLR
jgi:mono/diheme cytochrome c family protein